MELINGCVVKRRGVWLLALAFAWAPAADLARAAEASEAPPSAERMAELAGRTMGTTYRLKYWGEGAASPLAVHRKVEALLARFDKQMSTYRDDSELSRFNAAGANEWIAVSPETAAVVAAALEFHKSTGGALDVTVGPVLEAWNFGPEIRDQRAAFKPPAAEQIERAMRLVGAEHLQVRMNPPALRKDLEGITVDLSAIAPGYAVDLVTELLHSLGFAHTMVEIGGEVRGAGVRPDGNPWRIGVERAGAPDAPFVEIVELADLSLTTAGDYRNVRGGDGGQYTHIIDPRTGQALPYRGVAVTVLAESCMEADALDTALLVMGAEAGYQWCVEHNVAALFQEGEGDGGVKRTPRFAELARADDNEEDEP